VSLNKNYTLKQFQQNKRMCVSNAKRALLLVYKIAWNIFGKFVHYSEVYLLAFLS